MTLALEPIPETPAEPVPAAVEPADVGEQLAAAPIDAAEAAPAEESALELVEVVLPPAAPTAAERRERIESFLAAARLPPAMRDRLASALCDAAQPLAAETGEPLIRASQLATFIEQALPPALRLDPAAVGRPEHPAGETFFTGDPEALSDAQAEQVARAQLVRNGFLKK
jgi:ribonuclease E